MRVPGTTGSLVTFEGAPGIGRVEAVADGKARIVFFESPVEVEAESHWIALDRLRGVALDEQTRVFVPMVDGRWRAGRVVGGRAPNYFVRFPNVTYDVDIPEGSLRVRWDRGQVSATRRDGGPQDLQWVRYGGRPMACREVRGEARVYVEAVGLAAARGHHVQRLAHGRSVHIGVRRVDRPALSPVGRTRIPELDVLLNVARRQYRHRSPTCP